MSERVRHLIRQIAGGQRQIFTGVASQIDSQSGTCSVSPSDGGPPYFEVSLKPHPDASAFIIPVEGSEVVCAQLTDQYVVVIMVSDPETVVVDARVSIKLQAPNTEIELTQGVKIEANGLSLKTILTNLLTALQTLAPLSAAPGSPCVPNPTDIAKFQTYSTQIQSLLK